MDIGEPVRRITIEPVEDPVPREEPVVEPERVAPAQPETVPEKVGV